MSELTIVVLRAAVVIGLWVFIIAALLVLRSDLFGTTVVTRSTKGRKDARRDQRPSADPSAPVRVRSEPAPIVTTLVVTAGPLRGQSLVLGATPVLIGRAPECTLVLDDDYASNRHARIFPDTDGWAVEDLGSTNGTLLSDRRITEAVPFKPGARIRIGRTEIELRRGPR